MSNTPAQATLEPAQAADFEALLALRLRAMRESLERLGRYDEERARQRLAAGFDPSATQHIVVQGQRVGFIVLKRDSEGLLLDHLYIDPAAQSRGIGSHVLEGVLAGADAQQLPVRVTALKRSASNRFYQQHGFIAQGESEWDVHYLRTPQSPAVQRVRALWAAFEARDWTGARALLRDDLQATWWTSGERFCSADAFTAAQAHYPEGWTIRLIECSQLGDGRVLSLVRVEHPPAVFYGTSLARVDDAGCIASLDEYWATAGAPPAWRSPAMMPGLQRFDALDNPRARRP